MSFWPMGFLRCFPILGTLSLRMIKHVFSMDGSRETKIECFLKERSILGRLPEVLEFRVQTCSWDLTMRSVRVEGEHDLGLVVQGACP